MAAMRRIRPYLFVALILFLIGSWPRLLSTSAWTITAWWTPGNGAVLRSMIPYENPYGWLTILNTSGDVPTKNNAFFDPIGTNGRACVTCHQPADGMSISAESIRQRWGITGGSDPLFAAVDGKNCPDLPDEYPQSHSLLLDRGLIRVPLPWPPKAADGTALKPEFTIEVVRDPTGCNTSPVYGLNSPTPVVSVYRRPRPAANLKYVIADGFGVGRFIAKDGQPTERDPETGKLVQMNMMADAREPSLRTQARSAASGHLQLKGPLSDAQLDQIVAFETQLYAAQSYDWTAGLGSRSARARQNRSSRKQHGELRVSDGRPLETPSAYRRRRARRSERISRICCARPRCVLLSNLLDQRCDAPQHGRSRQSGQTHLRDLPWKCT